MAPTAINAAMAESRSNLAERIPDGPIRREDRIVLAFKSKCPCLFFQVLLEARGQRAAEEMDEDF
jgi:hypothetical protein